METSLVTSAHVMTYLMRKDVSTRKTTQHSMQTLMQPIVLNTEEPHVKVPVVEIRVETQVVKAVLTPVLQTTTLLQALNPLINMET